MPWGILQGDSFVKHAAGGRGLILNDRPHLESCRMRPMASIVAYPLSGVPLWLGVIGRPPGFPSIGHP
jgi:hypothetical protein